MGVTIPSACKRRGTTSRSIRSAAGGLTSAAVQVPVMTLLRRPPLLAGCLPLRSRPVTKRCPRLSRWNRSIACWCALRDPPYSAQAFQVQHDAAGDGGGPCRRKVAASSPHRVSGALREPRSGDPSHPWSVRVPRRPIPRRTRATVRQPAPKATRLRRVLHMRSGPPGA